MNRQWLLSYILSIILCSSAGVLLPEKTKTVSAEFEQAKAVCVMEQESRRILYESRGDMRLPMASTTKIATAITVLDACEDITTEFSIPDEAVGVEGSSVYLQYGDVYSVEDLLYGLMLRSGNDCATALALYVSGNIGNFSVKMNETAQRAGALATSFKNPHGLPCDGHYTTARDLSLITCYAMENPTFRKIVSTKYYEPRHWKNKNKMLETCDGGCGVKTGYTKEAGRCLVSAVEREEMCLICTVLSCPNMFEYSVQLLDDAFAAYKRVKLLSAGEEFYVGEGKQQAIGYSHEDFYYPLMEGEEEQLEIRTNAVQDKEIVGQIEIYLSNRLLFSGNLYKL